MYTSVFKVLGDAKSKYEAISVRGLTGADPAVDFPEEFFLNISY